MAAGEGHHNKVEAEHNLLEVGHSYHVVVVADHTQVDNNLEQEEEVAHNLDVVVAVHILDVVEHIHMVEHIQELIYSVSNT